MPLPAALLNRLKKRGIVQQDNTEKEQVEEVFAESYDEKENNNLDGEAAGLSENQHDVTEAAALRVKLVYEVADCPNKANRYHECTDQCKTQFGLKSFTHRLEDDSRRLRLLRKYPLPAGWKEVGDPVSGRCYYWNSETDKVSWLPPQHPRAKITVSAEKLMSHLDRAPPSSADIPEQRERRKPVSVSIREPSSKRSRRQLHAADELDPMDPASYSEVERGTWSTGLKADTKTGVDTTASGPLFQQRPYPSPGDILRAQANPDT